MVDIPQNQNKPNQSDYENKTACIGKVFLFAHKD